MSQPPPIIRVTADDLMSLVSERGSTPLQVGAVLLLEARGGLDRARALDLLARRITAVPRLRQRLENTPFGCGRPIWFLTGQGAAIDTTTASGKLVFGISAALAEFERELISERTIAGLASARARGRNGGRPYKMTPAKLRLAKASMGQPGTKVSDVCTELGITRQTHYRHVSPTGELRPDGTKVLSRG
ncbi:recombinase family protein [Pseudarthrobacter sp. AB1]|uniref:recombinase family protein n=1 Tax=Pseudarthrobacter sp. AB1 TaxID=2138309 RepID=UPI00186B6914|nr:recombinase family protein [Pseudarthrobacter sp. AB1]MBE4718984.1 hypothetical protein [Pseudarthrobacter sp. AB1]